MAEAGNFVGAGVGGGVKPVGQLASRSFNTES
jgi:hypothetical protein